ncbi:MAG: ribosomal RNA small subunit methyltransferase A [Verrucomicrobia bacterium]|nr:MAG: ribosomal RNA small subunit methyltransferase A [Verrucomicrobiota bacterium]
MKLSEIRATLQEIRVSPVKTLGQNFLHDQNLARWIVDQADITPDDYVVEIGPGLGALTELVLKRGARILAVEKDTRLANFLREHLRHPRLEVMNIDALKFDGRVLFSHRRVKLLGNLPYNVSSALLLKFLGYPSAISLWLLMLQKEMALRLSASPSTRDYGSLTLHAQLHHHVQYLRAIPPTVFFPGPDVDSAVVRVLPRDPLELPARDDELLAKLIRDGFSQRRKQLQKFLRAHVTNWDHAASTLGFDPKARAEELSLLQWIGLANYIVPPARPDTQALKNELFLVVDENDRILRCARRSDVHGNNLRHRAVHILIFSQADEVYLQQRSRGKDRHPLKWDSSAAGHVGTRESYDEAARRELKEELGVNVPLKGISKLPASERTDQEFIWLYGGEIRGNPTPNRSEIETGAFFPPAVVDGWVTTRPEDFAPGFLECWKVYRKNKPANCDTFT